MQWATEPSQGGPQPGQWQQLVEADREFLRWQLAASHVNVVLVNGASVVRGLQDAKLVSNWTQDDLRYETANGPGKLRVFRARVDGVLLLGWNRPLAGPIPVAGRTALTEWVTREIESTTAAAESRGLAEPDHLAGHAGNGFIPAGTVAESVTELESLLDTWLRSSGQHTIGEVGTFGGAPLITVRAPVGEFVLNRDTKQAAVAAFLSAARAAGGADRLPWHAAPNARDVANRMSYRPGDMPAPGWYAYLRAPRTPAGAAQ